MRRILLATLAVALFAVAPGSAIAAKGETGNSASARACQENFQDLVGGGVETFKNRGECTRFAAQGGTLGPNIQALCESLGGTYGTTVAGPSSDVAGVPVFFSCAFDPPLYGDQSNNEQVSQLIAGCFEQGGAPRFTTLPPHYVFITDFDCRRQ